MKRTRSRLGVLLAALLTVAAALGFGLGRASAAGIPTQTPLFYSGYLKNNGSPLTGAHLIQVNLWTDPTSTATSDRACATTPVGSTPVKAGSFRVALDASCLQAVHQDPDLYAEVVVDGTPLPRSKVGAVPYAVEADAASHAAGSLEARLTSLAHPVATNPTSGLEYSLDAVYCGETAPTTGAVSDGNLRGYAAAKSLCETACGSASAHMCTAVEMARTSQLQAGAPTVAGWYASAMEYQAIDRHGTLMRAIDCNKWTDGTGTVAGPTWGGGSLGFDQCNNSNPILCCD